MAESYRIRNKEDHSYYQHCIDGEVMFTEKRKKAFVTGDYTMAVHIARQLAQLGYSVSLVKQKGDRNV